MYRTIIQSTHKGLVPKKLFLTLTIKK